MPFCVCNVSGLVLVLTGGSQQSLHSLWIKWSLFIVYNRYKCHLLVKLWKYTQSCGCKVHWRVHMNESAQASMHIPVM